MSKIISNIFRPLVISVLVSMTLIFIYERFVLVPSGGGQSQGQLVSFNSIKFVNSQKAFLARTLTPGEEIPDDISISMGRVARMSKEVKGVIKGIAGSAIVVSPQMLVLPESVPDITDQVLAHFDLPIDVAGTPSFEVLNPGIDFNKDNKSSLGILNIEPLSKKMERKRGEYDNAKRHLP